MTRNRKKTAARIIICVLLLFVMISAFVKHETRQLIGEEEIDRGAGKHNGKVSVDPIGQNEGYSAVLYNNQNGLPTSEANDIVETADGFIWIGSYSGLIRYDGSTFERIDSTTGITSVKCLYVDSRGRLWIGTNSNGIALMEHGNLRMWGSAEGLKSTSIRSIVEDPQGRVLFATTQGLLMIDDDLNLSYLDDDRIKDDFLHDLRIGSDGTVYGVTNSGNVFLIQNGTVSHYYDFHNSPIKGINCLFPDPMDPDLVYFETTDSIVHHCSLDDAAKNPEPIDITPLSQIQVFECFEDNIWICARNGIGVLNETGFHLLKNVPMNNSVSHMMSDYQGNLWFTSTRQGVMKIVPNRFIDLFERYDLSDTVVNSTCMFDDQLFVATDQGLIVLDDQGSVESIPLKEASTANGLDLGYRDLLQMLDGCRIRSIISDSENRLWISSWRRYGLLCYEEGTVTAFTVEDGLFSDAVRSVCECTDGSILVAVTGGVNVIKNGKVTAAYGSEDGISNTEILTVAQGKNKDILLGSDGGGIFIISEGGIRNISYKDGLTSGAVMRIKYDEDHHVYWIVTGDSLAYMDENYELTTISNFPYSNNFDIYANSKDELWVLCSNGIYAASIDDLLKNEKIDVVHYSMSNGLPCIATANSYSELTEEGDLYIAGTTGIAKTNIEMSYENVSDLMASVPFVEIDGRTVYPDETGTFVLPNDFVKLAICGHVYAYSLVEPIVSCRLEQIDKYSNTGNPDSVFPAYYTNLPGGTYYFVMDLMDSIGNISKTVSVKIVKDRAFYEEPWFFAVALLLSGAIIYLTAKTYVNRRIYLMEKKHKEEAEKKRISDELTMAGRIQRSMLPHVFPPFPDRKEFEIYALMDPAKGVGGDFYDFFMIDRDHLCLIMADVSGKGIPGALFMMISKIILQSLTKSGMSPADVLTRANEMICLNNPEEMFVTVWIGILQISTGKLIAANAGHEYPAIKYADGRFELLKDRHDFVIGGIDGFRYNEYQLDLLPGTKLFLYTDGVPEATDKEDKMFGIERMIEALNIEPEENPEKIISNVRKAINDFAKDAEQFDDLTMLCLDYKGNDKR